MSDVYVVRLSEEAHNWLIGLAADADTSWMSPGNQDIAREASNALESARPEHPERQAALEELWASMESALAIEKSDYGDFFWVVFATESDNTRFLSVIDRLRSLEGK